MSDRLTELQRQRALLQEHLTWLDHEISAAQAGRPAPPPNSPSISPSVPSPAPQFPANGDAAAAEKSADEIIAQYKQQGDALQDTVKRGCFLYFFVAMALLGIGVFLLYLFRTKH